MVKGKEAERVAVGTDAVAVVAAAAGDTGNGVDSTLIRFCVLEESREGYMNLNDDRVVESRGSVSRHDPRYHSQGREDRKHAMPYHTLPAPPKHPLISRLPSISEPIQLLARSLGIYLIITHHSILLPLSFSLRRMGSAMFRGHRVVRYRT